MSINDIPTVGDLKRAVAVGQRITPEDVSQIAQAESEFTGGGPIKGGPAGYLDLYYVLVNTRN